MRPQTTTFMLLASAAAILLFGMGLVATAQVQEAYAISEEVGVRRLNRWLLVPGLMLMAASVVMVVIAFERAESKERVLPHILLFILITVGLLIFLPITLGIGRIVEGEPTDLVRSWVYFGFLGPLGDIPTSPDARYMLVPYVAEYATILGSLLLVWYLGKPHEFLAFIRGILLREKDLSDMI